MARSGLFVAPVPGTPPVGTAPQDARIALAGLLGTVPQCVEGGSITQSGSSMQITVGPSVWELPDVTSALAIFLSATDQTVVTPAAGPATGTRTDSIVLKQNNVENSDADSRVNMYLKGGTSTPTGPALSAGEYRWANVVVPAGASNASQATVTLLSPTTLLALPLNAPTLALLNTVTGQPGQLASVTADPTSTKNGLYGWDGSTWRPGGVSAMALSNISWQGIYSSSGSSPVKVVKHGGRVWLEGVVVSSSATFLAGTVYTLGNIPTALAPATTQSFSCTSNHTAVAELTVDQTGLVTIILDVGFTGTLLLGIGDPSWRAQ